MLVGKAVFGRSSFLPEIPFDLSPLPHEASGFNPHSRWFLGGMFK